MELPTGPNGNADVPGESAFDGPTKDLRIGSSGELLSSAGYAVAGALCASLAVLLAMGGAHHVGVWLLALPVFDFVMLVVLVIVLTPLITGRAQTRSLALHALGIACIAYACGVLFAWYRQRFAVHADFTHAVLSTLLLVIAAYVAGIVLALRPRRSGRRNLAGLVVGILLPSLLLVTSLIPLFYHGFFGFVRTTVAILITCHLAYVFTAIARRPHYFKFVLDLTMVFIIDSTLMLGVLLGV